MVNLSGMSAEGSTIVVCRSCGAKNRVPLARTGDRPICGRCRAPLDAGAAPPADGPVEVTDESFPSVVLGSGVPVLLDCWAPWCGPCRTVGPVVDSLARAWGGKVRVAKLNVDENPATVSRLGIQSIPTLVIFRGGRELDRKVGALPGPAIERWVASHL